LYTTRLALETIDGLSVGIRFISKALNVALASNPFKRITVNWGEEGGSAVSTNLTSAMTANVLLTHTYATAGEFKVEIKVYTLVPAVGETPATEQLNNTYTVYIFTDIQKPSCIIESVTSPEFTAYDEMDPDDYEITDISTVVTARINTGGKGVILHKIYTNSVMVLDAGSVAATSWLDFTQENEIVEVTKEYDLDNIPSSKVTFIAYDPRGFFDVKTLGTEVNFDLPDVLEDATAQDTTATISNPGAGTGGTITE
jgi:hypothetical protein